MTSKVVVSYTIYLMQLLTSGNPSSVDNNKREEREVELKKKVTKVWKNNLEFFI